MKKIIPTAKHKGFFLVIASFVVIILIILVFVGSAAFIGSQKGSGSDGTVVGGTGGTGDVVNCAGTNIDARYYEFVKDAAARWLGGDEAALIAIVQIESGWRVDARNPNSNATGLGQFITSSARDWPEFVGGYDGPKNTGKFWNGGQIYDDPSAHSDDARFDPERSVYATAHYLSGMLQKYGSLGAAYEEGYHGYCKTGAAACQKQQDEAKDGRQRLEKEYSDLRSGGGCTQVGTSSVAAVNTTGEPGKYCGVFPVNQQLISWASSNSSPYLMPPAAASFDKLSAAYKNQNKSLLPIASMYRSYAQQQFMVDQYKKGVPGYYKPASPGTSPHESGLAFDFSGFRGLSEAKRADFRSLAAQFGWKPLDQVCTNDSSNECHHFEYIPGRNQFAGTVPAIQAAHSTSCKTQS